MPKVLVIADDFTGANATGVLLKEKGFRSVSFLNYQNANECTDNSDVYCIDTDTRSKDPRYAYNLVKNIANQFRDKVSLFSKRIDSTLRGNIGSEIDGILDGLQQNYKAVVVAAYPKSGRISIGGYLLVDSKPLQKTGVSEDVKTPVKSSNILNIIKMQSSKNVGYISLDEVLEGPVFLSNRIANNSNDIIVIDAVSNEDIDVIAKACILSKIPIICVDPGPFTAYVSFNLLKQNVYDEKRILLVIGSVTELTRKQVKYLLKNRNTLVCNVSVNNIIKNLNEEVTKVLKYVKENYVYYKYICIITALNDDDVIDLKLLSKTCEMDTEKLSYKISDGLVEIAKQILEDRELKINYVYLSGGDISQEFLRNLNSFAFEIVDEVIPLAVHGLIKGGEYDGLNVVTKGGLVGSENSLDYIVSYIEKLNEVERNEAIK